MSTKNRLSSLLVVCFLLLIVLNSPARANYAVQQITDNSWTYNPKVNNRGMVVWVQTGTDFINQIYLYNNGAVSQISHSITGSFLPGINDNGQITWWQFDEASNSYQVFLYDNGPITRISSNNNGNRIEAPNAYSQYPHINNKGEIAWIGLDGLCLQVFLYSNGTVYKISHNDEDGWARGNSGVEINDAGQVVWAGDTSVMGNSQIYLYQNGGAYQISYPDTRDAEEPHLNNNGQIVWRATTGTNDYYLYYYNNGDIIPAVQVDSYANGYDITDAGDILLPGNDGLGYRYSHGILSRISNDITSVGTIFANGYPSVFSALNTAGQRKLYVYCNGALTQVSTNYPSDYEISSSGLVAWTSMGIYLGAPGSCGPGIINLLLLN
jgi:hypothetical protein